MSSARSVSQAAMPSASRASLRPISWVAIDLTLTTSSTPWSRATRATIAQASAASRAQWTVAPPAVRDASSCSRWVARSRSAASLTAAPATRSSSQSSHLGDDPGPLVADGAGGVREVVAQLGVAQRGAGGLGEGRHPDEGAAGHALPRPGADRRTVGAALGVLGGGQDLGEVHGAYAGALAREQPADVHQARVVAGDEHLGSGLAHVARLVGAHRDRGVGVLEREGAAEAAALLGLRQVDEGQPAHLLEQLPRAGRRPRASAASGRSGGRSPCAGSRRRRRSRRARRRGTRSARRCAGRSRRRPPPGRVPGAAGHDRVLVARGPGARAARRHDGVVPREGVDEGADDGDRLVEVAGVDHRLARSTSAPPGSRRRRRAGAAGVTTALPVSGIHRVVDAGDHAARPSCVHPAPRVTRREASEVVGHP